jgi:hypothetical protein
MIARGPGVDYGMLARSRTTTPRKPKRPATTIEALVETCVAASVFTLTVLAGSPSAAGTLPVASNAPKATHRHVLQGLVIGAGAGALLGFGLHHCPPTEDPHVPPCPTFRESMIDTALVLGAVGAGVGYLIRTDVRPKFLRGNGNVAIQPRQRGVAVAATLRF